MPHSHQIIIFLASVMLATVVCGAEDPYAEPENPGLPPSTMELDLTRTALVVTDPQIDFLGEEGVTWGLVGSSVTANNTVENIERLFKAAKENGVIVMISPHYYYPTDHGWKFRRNCQHPWLGQRWSFIQFNGIAGVYICRFCNSCRYDPGGDFERVTNSSTTSGTK